jgi:hypothetical protein
MPIRRGAIFANRASTWPRDHFCHSTIAYAVLSFGGFLGIGDDHYPLPWQSLKYNTNLGGYRAGITETQLKGAPKYGNDNAWNWSDPARTRSVNDYYGVAI